MQIKATLNNFRMPSRKVRLITGLVKGMKTDEAKAQLRFMNKKAAGIVLKLLESGIANAKHNFSLEENNLFIADLRVEDGPSLKRWMPRAMGRAAPILKRTCNVNLILQDISGKAKPPRKKAEKESKWEETKPLIEKEEKISALPGESELKAKPIAPPRPYRASGEAKKRFFSRQTFGNIKRMFRRKSI